jgi:hypothetical protein
LLTVNRGNNFLSKKNAQQPPAADNGEKREILFFELTKRRYDEELERRRELDSKAGNLIAHVTIITGVIIGLGTFSIVGNISDPWHYVPYYSGIILLLASIISSLIAARVRAYESSPAIPGLRELREEEGRNYISIIEELIDEMSKAVVINKGENDRKAFRISISWWFLIVGLISLFVYTAVIGSQGILVVPITNSTSTLQN